VRQAEIAYFYWSKKCCHDAFDIATIRSVSSKHKEKIITHKSRPNWQLHDGDLIQSMDWKVAAKMAALALNASISKAASVPLHLVVERSGKKLPLTIQGRECHCIRNTRLRELVPA